MGQDSRIAWTSHTFNPWWGCTKVSDGCANCYAETLARRYGGDHWGAGKPRRVFGPRHWQEMAAICGRPMAARDLAPDGTAWAWRAGTVARAGEDPAEWPEHLRVRQVPTPAGSQIAAREARC